MSNSQEALRRQLGAATELKSVVRAMKALAAANLAKFERTVSALKSYSRTVELGLIACLRDATEATAADLTARRSITGIVLFGSDQGLVGQFNESIVDHAHCTITPEGAGAHVWAIGERVAAAAAERGFCDVHTFENPTSIQSIGRLVGRLAVAIQEFQARNAPFVLHIVHHQPSDAGRYVPQSRRILPVDRAWMRAFESRPWPTRLRPEILAAASATFDALVREYLFTCLYQACAESLASENANRMIAMQRAEKNIDDMTGTLRREFSQLRQLRIDEELFDVISGVDAR